MRLVGCELESRLGLLSQFLPATGRVGYELWRRAWMRGGVGEEGETRRNATSRDDAADADAWPCCSCKLAPVSESTGSLAWPG